MSPGQPGGAGDATPVILTTRRVGPRDAGGARAAAGGQAVDWRLLVAGVLLGGLTVASLFVAVGPGFTRREPEPTPLLPAQPAPQAVASDPRPRDSGGTIARAEQPAAKAETSNPMPAAAPAPTGPSAEELANEAARQKAEADHKEQEARNTVRLQAFRDLRVKLEQACHLPLKANVNLESQDEQVILLCELGTAEVGVALPERLTFKVEPDKPEWKLEHVGEPTGPWVIRLTGTAAAQALDLAKVEVQQEEAASGGGNRMLSLRLLKMPNAKDPVWVAGRQALTTVPLVLRPVGEKPGELETFVQPCTPKRIEPLRFEKLLTDKRWLPSGKTPAEPLEGPPLPETPWPYRVEFVGQGADGITATVTTKPSATKAGAPQPRSEPLLLTATWTWSGEEDQPFMETTFAVQNRASVPEATVTDAGGGVLEIRLEKSQVLPPWNGWRRLVDLKEAGADAPPTPLLQLPLTPPSAFKQGVPPANDIPIGIFAAYSDIARQYVPRLTHKEVQGWLASAAGKNVKVGLEDWRQIIRARLRTTKGFGGWVHRVAPLPPASNRDVNGNYLYTTDREAMQRKHAQYFEAGPEVVQEYWDSLKADAARRAAEREEVILCCLHFEVEPVLNEKLKTKQLLETVGDGTVELTGRLWAAPPAAGKHHVLLAEFGEPAIRAAAAPLPPELGRSTAVTRPGRPLP